MSEPSSKPQPTLSILPDAKSLTLSPTSPSSAFPSRLSIDNCWWVGCGVSPSFSSTASSVSSSPLSFRSDRPRASLSKKTREVRVESRLSGTPVRLVVVGTNCRDGLRQMVEEGIIDESVGCHVSTTYHVSAQ